MLSMVQVVLQLPPDEKHYHPYFADVETEAEQWADMPTNTQPVSSGAGLWALAPAPAPQHPKVLGRKGAVPFPRTPYTWINPTPFSTVASSIPPYAQPD